MAGVPPIMLLPNSSSMGGMEAHLIQLAGGLRRRGIRVAAIWAPSEQMTPLRDGLTDAGATVHTLEERDGTLGGVGRRLRALVEAIKQYPGCVIHMHFGGYGGGELVQVAARLGGASAVVRTEHVPPVPPITRKGRMLVHVRDRFLARVICVSEQNRQEHLKTLGREARQLMVVHNGVDVTQFTPLVSGAGVAAEFGFEADAPIVGTMARLVEKRKGLNYFVNMAAAVHAAAPSVRFLMVGDGPLKAELQAQAASLGLAPDVLVFPGERKDIERLYAAFAVFVMPSLYEGCQYALLEAMAMGRPVVTTAAGVAPVVVRDHETGIMVPFHDADGLSRGVLEVINDPALAGHLGASAREVIVQRFSLDAMVDNLVDVYRAVAAA